MALQNRVTPFSELIANPTRSLVYGNRGCLLDASGTIVRTHQVKRWIACRLEFKGRHRMPLVQPGRYTPLFFLDEATAFAAGHRPCAECRRADYAHFSAIWARRHGEQGADVIDVRLHLERRDGPRQRLHRAKLAELLDGAIVGRGGEPSLVLDDFVLRWTPAGYVEPTLRARGEVVTVLAPPSLLDVLNSSWRPAVPLLHSTAQPSSKLTTTAAL